MKKVLGLAVCLALAACATDSGNQPPPAPPAPVQKPVSTVFRSWYELRQRDVVEARALEDAIRKLNGVPVEAEIGKVAQKDDEGKSVVVDIWKGINLGVPPTQLKKRAADLQRAVTMSAEFAGNRSAMVRYEIHVSEADKPAVKKWLDAGFAQARAKTPTDVQWKPLKRGDLPFIRIEPSDSHYAFGPLT